MKKCPTCDKTFEDSMKFCQVDGTVLVDDEPAFDPYATIVSTPAKPIPTAPAETSDTAEAAPESVGDQTVGSIAIPPPDDLLDLPENDPLKTMYVSDAEMQSALSPEAEEPVLEVEPPMPTPPEFLAPEVPAEPSAAAPPPSPFSTPDPEPVFEEPAPSPSYDEAATVMQPRIDIPFEAPAPVQEWTPPPAPDANWQNQQIGSNTPFQPPPAGVGGQNKTLPIVSLVLGIISLCCYIGWLTGPAALITGFLALRNIKSDPTAYEGKTLAIIGMILGGLFTALWILYWLVIILVYAGILGASMLPTT